MNKKFGNIHRNIHALPISWERQKGPSELIAQQVFEKSQYDLNTTMSQDLNCKLN